MAESPSMVCYKFSSLSSVRYFSLTSCWRHVKKKVPAEALPFPILVRTQMTVFEDAQKFFMLVSQLSILLMWSHMEDNLIALLKKWKQHRCYKIT